MEQKKIYRTLEVVDSKNYKSEEALFNDVVKQLIVNDQINITGARIWKLIPEKEQYLLIIQKGNVQEIQEDFRVNIADYPVFNEITRERTILADETNESLKEKGIFRYSASGVGNKTRIGKKHFYEYLLACNSENIDEELRNTLNIVAAVLTSKIKEKRVIDSKKSLVRDIDSAKQLQKSLLPDHELVIFDYEIFGVTIPAVSLGGDFFDYLKIGEDEDRLGIVLGDAASKGIAAAAEAMYISGAIRMASTFQIKISPFINRVNQLVHKIFGDEKFTSLFYGEISKDRKGLFLYANAGHNPPMFFRFSEKDIIRLDPTGPLLGLVPKERYETDSINFKSGDILVIFSDGIVEAADEKFDFYEDERLQKVIMENYARSPKELAYLILDDVEKFSTSQSKYQDDKTLVIIKRK